MSFRSTESIQLNLSILLNSIEMFVCLSFVIKINNLIAFLILSYHLSLSSCCILSLWLCNVILTCSNCNFLSIILFRWHFVRYFIVVISNVLRDHVTTSVVHIVQHKTSDLWKIGTEIDMKFNGLSTQRTPEQNYIMTTLKINGQRQR